MTRDKTTAAAGFDRDFEDFPLHRFMGLSLVESRPGYARLRMTTGPNTLGGIGGSVHGGLLAAMADVVMLRAISTVFEPGDQPAGTADLNITYLRPALGTHVDAEARVLRKGRQLAVIEVNILDEQERLCARSRILYAFRR